MHTIITIGEAEVDIASAELYLLRLVLLLMIGADDRRVVHGATIGTLQHTALQPYLIGSCQYRDIVEQYLVVATIGKEQQTGNSVVECLELSIETLQMVYLDVLGLAIIYKVVEGAVLFFGNVEALGHRVEHIDSLNAITAAELHQTQ